MRMTRTLLRAVLGIVACASALHITRVEAQDLPPGDEDPIDQFFDIYDAQPDEFSRFLYVNSVQPGDNYELQDAVNQYLATEFSFLGRPADAIRVFPAFPIEFSDVVLPDRRHFFAFPAADAIALQAWNRQIVMVNEAHHVAQTRVLTLALLPRLRALGYTHFAIEALSQNDIDLATRGYPVYDLTGYYTAEPVFGEMIREALRLGYVLVPYEAIANTQQARETGQAENIVHRVFDAEPNAKLLVHAGYAHIDEQPGNLGSARPMAMELKRLTGIDPLTIDQTVVPDAVTDTVASVYDELISRFPVLVPSVLVSRSSLQSWAIEPSRNDINVLLPKVAADDVRPSWLRLGVRRVPVRIAADLRSCLADLPCLAEARYADESADAVPADQFVILDAAERTEPLYLKPGSYRLDIRNASGQTVGQRNLRVGF